MKRFLRRLPFVMLTVFLLTCSAAAATSLRLESVEDETFHYVIPGTDQGVYTFTEDGESADMAFLSIDSGVYWKIWKDGKLTNLEEATLFTEKGEYELYVALKPFAEKSQYVYRFSVSGTGSFFGSGSCQDVEEVYLEAYDTFGYQYGEEALFALSVPNGAVSVKPVIFYGYNAALLRTIYVNGERAETSDYPDNVFEKNGSYLLELYVPSGGFTYWITFDINSEGVFQRASFPGSKNFLLQTKIGRADNGSLQKSVFLTKDGLYRLSYLDTAGREVWSTSEFQRDTIAPSITFSANVYGKHVSTDVEFEPHGGDVSVFLDDIPLTVSENRLENDGPYELIIRDRAGNERTYDLSIYQFKEIRTLGGLAALVGFLYIVYSLRRRGG